MYTILIRVFWDDGYAVFHFWISQRLKLDGFRLSPELTINNEYALSRLPLKPAYLLYSPFWEYRRAASTKYEIVILLMRAVYVANNKRGGGFIAFIQYLFHLNVVFFPVRLNSACTTPALPRTLLDVLPNLDGQAKGHFPLRAGMSIATTGTMCDNIFEFCFHVTTRLLDVFVGFFALIVVNPNSSDFV